MMMPLMLNSKADAAIDGGLSVIKRADDASGTCDADTLTTVNHHRHQSETPNLQLNEAVQRRPDLPRG